MKLIETKTLASAQSEITFTNIPQNFRDILIKMSVRGNNLNFQGLRIYFNGVASNLTTRYLLGDGSSRATGTLSYGFAASISGTSSTSNTFSNGDLYIPNYSGSANKVWSTDSVTENNATNSFQNINSGVWSSTAPITSFTLFGETAGGGTNELIAGTVISLYGIGGVGDGYAAPKATGGVISYADGYTIHTFFASGTFTPIIDINNVEYLVVAGGGGAGRGGGGAGGLRSTTTATGGGGSLESKISLTATTNYTVTVGSGGTFGNDSVQATNGGSSSFGSITSLGGGFGGRYTAPNAGSGGSGGGGESSNFVGTGGAGTTNQGFNGGSAGTTFSGSAGGGGAGAAGTNGSSSSSGPAGNGGNGVGVSITGSSIFYGGGGAGGNHFSSTVGTPGTGGGGAAGLYGTSSPNGQNGTANTGGGGGGGSGQTNVISSNGGNGGSGIVIVRYAA